MFDITKTTKKILGKRSIKGLTAEQSGNYWYGIFELYMNHDEALKYAKEY